MTAETLKPFLTLPNTVSSQNKKNTNATINNIRFYSCCCVFVIFFIAISGLEIWNTIRTNELKVEIKEMQQLLDSLQLRLILDPSFDDLTEFKKSYDSNDIDTIDDGEDIYINDDYTDDLPSNNVKNYWLTEEMLPKTPTDKYAGEDDTETGSADIYGDFIDDTVNDNDDDDDLDGMVFDWRMEDLVNNEETTQYTPDLTDDGILIDGNDDIVDDITDTDTDTDDSDEVIEDTDNDDNLKKLSLRYRRSVTEKQQSSNGVPVIEESYALRRNRTDKTIDDMVKTILLNRHSRIMPKMKYDWNNNNNNNNNDEYKRRDDEVIGRVIVEKPAELRDTLTSDIKSRRSRVMHTNEDKSKAFRQIMTKRDYFKWQEKLDPHLRDANLNEKSGKQRVSRHMYKSLEGTSRGRIGSGQGRSNNNNNHKGIAAHYSADPSQYIVGHPHHEHYVGNGLLRHPGGIFIDWKAAPWMNNSHTERNFKMDTNGVLTVKNSGLYHLYAQIYYHDDHDTNSYEILHNNGRILQCTTTTHSTGRITKSNTCFTSSLVFIKSGDTIHLSDMGSNRFILLDNSKSFFGLIKIAEI